MIETALVIGGGIGGLAVATALAQRGVSVSLAEQAATISEVGAGLQISPNGLAVLRALGLEAPLDQTRAVQAQAVELRDYRAGDLVARLDLQRLQDQRYLFVHRADLITVLVRAAQDAGVSIQLGRRVDAVHKGEPPEVRYADGGQAQAQLVVCADGLHSVGRAALNGAAPPRFTGQVAWRAVVPQSDMPPVATVNMAPGQHIVTYPMRGQSCCNIVAVEERAHWVEEGWHHAGDPDEMRRVFAQFTGPVQYLLKQVDTVHLWGLFRHPVATTWMDGGTALLGDAAHPTLPFLAQGANMALEDAWVLAETVATSAPLETYQSRRRTRCERIVDAASKNAARYHLRHGPLRLVAHGALSLGSALAPGLMLRQFDWLYRHDVTDGRH